MSPHRGRPRGIRVTRKGEQKLVGDTPTKLTVQAVFQAHGVFIAAFQGYHNILEKPDSVEYKDGKAIVADLYAIAEQEKRAVKWVCAQFIEQNHLDWTINRFYNVVKSVHSRETGAPKERAEVKASYLEQAREKAVNAGLTEEQVKGAVKVAAYQHKKQIYADFVKANFDLEELIETIVIGKIDAMKSVQDKIAALDLLTARLTLFKAELVKTIAQAMPKAA